MRCAFLMKSISRLGGGVSVAVCDLAQRLQRDGVEMGVFATRDEQTREDRGRWNGSALHLFDTRGPHAFGFAPEYRAALDTYGAALAHCHGLWQYPSRACAAWAARHDRPYVVSPHGMLDPWALAHAHLKKRIAAVCFQRRDLRRATCLHALCDAEARAIRAYGLANPVCVIPNGVELPQSTEPAAPPWPAETVAGRRVLLFLGRLHPKKGLWYLFKAWYRLLRDQRSARAAWHLVVAGWDQGGHRAELEQRAASLGVTDSICFVGPLHGADKAAAFTHASGFVLPSLSEGMPVAVLEAWSYGLPVLMTPYCNIPAGFDAGAAVRIATPDTAGARDALDALVGMTDHERAAMGARGRQLVERQFTWDVISRQMRSVYEWLQTGGPAPACVRTE